VGSTGGTDPNPLINRLLSEPYGFKFFQAVRLMQLFLCQDDATVGSQAHGPEGEVIQFRANPTFQFPPSELYSIAREEPRKRPGQVRWRIAINFMGLFGPLGVLPDPYTQMVIDDLRQRIQPFRDFLDCFNHRLISLFYRAWEKLQIGLPSERGERELFYHYILCIAGLGTGHLKERLAVPDGELAPYALLIGRRRCSVEALRFILSDYFGVSVSIQQFVGAWCAVSPESQWRLGTREEPGLESFSHKILGDQIWGVQSRGRIRLGPLTLDLYRQFLSSGKAREALLEISRLAAGEGLAFELQLILDRKEIHGFQLNCEGDEALGLGWATWLKNDPHEIFEHDADETICLLQH
jgi:type VI secretion system protein ImpH